MNQDLWNELLILSYRYGLKFNLVRGHNKDPNPIHAFWNSVVDQSCTYMIQNHIMEEKILVYNTNTKIRNEKIRIWDPSEKTMDYGIDTMQFKRNIMEV